MCRCRPWRGFDDGLAVVRTLECAVEGVESGWECGKPDGECLINELTASGTATRPDGDVRDEG